ncbi:MAG: M20/M25/M40 family metallo-hydrolase, partial [Campylobacterales bacterium]|nr:M20/M25/M40 family metallo-hydrolase [Campylobacterales bacterium]
MRVIEIFEQLSRFCRCSGTYEPFKKYLEDFSTRCGYEIYEDQYHNLLTKKKDSQPKLALQSHYDIVCIEKSTIPEIVYEDGYIKAKNSTLGSDNGIGCAYMLALMEQGFDCEYLFTSDEEIGLIGANNLQIQLNAQYMLNLDSEEDSSICIGCAGGVDIFGMNQQSEYIQNTQNKSLYEIIINNLDGGHSGVDIDKNIPNAIKLLAQAIYESGGDLVDFNGGERINSIPKSAKAIVVSHKSPLPNHPNMVVKKLQSSTDHYKKLDPRIINFLYSFPNGVRGYDKDLDVVLNSINLAIVHNTIDGLQVSLSARSMENEELLQISKETQVLLQSFGFDVQTSGKYPAWKPQRNQFCDDVEQIYKQFSKDVRVYAIHAGLECAIFSKKYPQIQICSIGPNIFFPHSYN